MKKSAEFMEKFRAAEGKAAEYERQGNTLATKLWEGRALQFLKKAEEAKAREDNK